jgi:uncharacterized repeat protein (TIGR02543 family)
LNANGGKANVKSVTVTHGEKYPALPKATRKGYSFKGWYTAKSGGSKITESVTVSTEADQTIYAQWTANKYSVSFDAMGGKVSKSSKTVTFGQKHAALPTPTKYLKDFKGWYTKKSGGNKITASTKVSTAKDYTLYARWTAAKAKVVKCKVLNIRKDSENGSRVLGAVKAGKNVSVLAVSKYGGWYKVKYGDVTGWAASKYLKLN